MRIFKDCLEMIKEIDRELLTQGITVKVKHYQNKKLFKENQITKELIGVTFLISKPYLKRKEMLDFIFKNESDIIEQYCLQEYKDRISEIPLNPGSSFEIRKDLWHKFLNNNKFDYTYSERMYWQIENIIKCLNEDKHSRQAVLQIFQANIDNNKLGKLTRIPCSCDYQFIIRNNRLYCVYHMRSNDYFNHFAIDIWLAIELMIFIISKIKHKIKIGSLIYFCGSLHAYNWDLKKWVIY